MSDVSHRPIRPSDLDRIQLDRLNRDYEPVLNLCRLLLESSTLNLQTGRVAQFAFVFDMNRLFEEFVAEFLRRHKSRIRLGDSHLAKVEYQRRLGRLFGEFNMDADLVLTDDAGRSLHHPDHRLPPAVDVSRQAMLRRHRPPLSDLQCGSAHLLSGRNKTSRQAIRPSQHL